MQKSATEKSIQKHELLLESSVNQAKDVTPNLSFPYDSEPRQLFLSLWDPTKLYRWPLSRLHSLWFQRKIQLVVQEWNQEGLER